MGSLVHLFAHKIPENSRPEVALDVITNYTVESFYVRFYILKLSEKMFKVYFCRVIRPDVELPLQSELVLADGFNADTVY